MSTFSETAVTLSERPGMLTVGGMLYGPEASDSRTVTARRLAQSDVAKLTKITFPVNGCGKFGDCGIALRPVQAARFLHNTIAIIN